MQFVCTCNLLPVAHATYVKTGLNNVVLPTCSLLSTTLLGIVTPDCRLIQAQQVATTCY